MARLGTHRWIVTALTVLLLLPTQAVAGGMRFGLSINGSAPHFAPRGFGAHHRGSGHTFAFRHHGFAAPHAFKLHRRGVPRDDLRRFGHQGFGFEHRAFPHGQRFVFKPHDRFRHHHGAIVIPPNVIILKPFVFIDR